MTGRRSDRATLGRLSARARAIIARTRAAQAAIDRAIAGVDLGPGPGVLLGPRRDTGAASWLDRDINPRERARKRAQG